MASIASAPVISHSHYYATRGFTPPVCAPGWIQETGKPERRQLCPLELDLKPETRGHGCPRSNLESTCFAHIDLPLALDGSHPAAQTGCMHKSTAAALSLLLVGIVASAAPLPLRIAVSAGDCDRRDSAVCFTLPAAARRFQQLEDERGNLVPLQIDNEGHACFIEKDLKLGSEKTYRLVASERKRDPGAEAQVVREGSRLKCAIGQQPVFYYQAEMGGLPRPDI